MTMLLVESSFLSEAEMPLRGLEFSKTFNLDLLDGVLVSDYIGYYNLETALY